MANHLDMANIDSIGILHQRGWSQRRIARELGIDRETVARQLKGLIARPKPASAAEAPIGSEPIPAGSKPATWEQAPIGSAVAATASKPATVAEAPIGSGSDVAGPAGLIALAPEEPVSPQAGQASDRAAPARSTGSSSLFAASQAEQPA